MGRDATKPIFGVSDKARLKAVSLATQTGKNSGPYYDKCFYRIVEFEQSWKRVNVVSYFQTGTDDDEDR